MIGQIMIWWIFGYICGALLTTMIRIFDNQKKNIGTLRMDKSDPEEAPYLFLELNPDGMKKIRNNNTVIMDVKIENYLPRK